jgi:hypothetical protein
MSNACDLVLVVVGPRVRSGRRLLLVVNVSLPVANFSILRQFSLSPDPSSWGADISPNHAEPDDYLHNPDPRRDRKNDRGGNVFTYRGLTNLGCLLILVAGIVALL